MVRSMFSAIAGMRAHQSKMDVIGNNIANVNTYGYKAGRFTFQESLYQTLSKGTSGNTVYGGTNPSQVGYGSVVGTIDLAFGTSSYAPTGELLHSMIDGDGFFLVGPKVAANLEDENATDGSVSIYSDRLEYEDPSGLANNAGEVTADAALTSLNLTRVGDFKKDGDGYIVDGNGNVVYGFVPDVNEEGVVSSTPNLSVLRPIRVPLQQDEDADDDTELKPMNLGDISIDEFGNITGKVATSGDEEGGTGEYILLGRVALANVPNPNALEKTQNGYYNIGGNTGVVQAYSPTYGNTGKLAPNGLEMANVDLANEFADMITTQRGFQANTRMITVTDEMLQELVNLKR